MWPCCNSGVSFLNFNSFGASLTILKRFHKKNISRHFPILNSSHYSRLFSLFCSKWQDWNQVTDQQINWYLATSLWHLSNRLRPRFFPLGHKAIKNKTGRKYGTSNDEKHHDPKHLVLGRLSLRTSQHFEHSVTWFYPCSLRQAHRKHFHSFFRTQLIDTCGRGAERMRERAAFRVAQGARRRRSRWRRR